MRRPIVLLLALVLAAGLAAARPDAARAGEDSSAVAINTKDGSSLFRFAFNISRVAGDIVDNHNEAVAYSSCESCRTTAIAIQIVLVAGKPGTVTPTNVAVAVNDQCTLCQTFASAYQFVVGTGDGPVTFTKDGWKELARIKREIKALRREDLAPAELDARMKAIVQRLRAVLQTQLVPARERGGDDDEDERGSGDENDGEQRDLGADERPKTSTAAEDEGGDTITTPEPPPTTTVGETGTTPTETTPTESTPTESTPTEPAETTTTTTETGTTTGE